MGRAFFGVASFFLINTLAALLNSSKKINEDEAVLGGKEKCK
jgi:hypothetical protein